MLDKSISSMLSAIEIYNKPNFLYREESFAILAINAWELLLKAYLLRKNHYKLYSIYELENKRKKDGSISSRKQPKLNRCGNPQSISIYKAVEVLKFQNELPTPLVDNIYSIIELRDNSIHFINTRSITKQIQELGFACIKNYITIIKKWNLEIDLSEYNFYLMPLAYVDARIEADSVLTSEAQLYVDFIKSKLNNQKNTDEEFDIAISIDIGFKKGSSFDSIGVKYDSEGVAIALSEENIRERFPLTHGDVTKKCRERYSDFKQNKQFNDIMKQVKLDNKLHHSRKLNPNNKKSIQQIFYSSNIWKELDNHYTKK